MVMKERSANLHSLTHLEANLGLNPVLPTPPPPATQPHVFLSLTHRLLLATSKHTDL